MLEQFNYVIFQRVWQSLDLFGLFLFSVDMWLRVSFDSSQNGRSDKGENSYAYFSFQLFVCTYTQVYTLDYKGVKFTPKPLVTNRVKLCTKIATSTLQNLFNLKTDKKKSSECTMYVNGISYWSTYL